MINSLTFINRSIRISLYKRRAFCFYPNIQLHLFITTLLGTSTNRRTPIGLVLHSSVRSFLKANQRGPLMFAVVYLRRLLHQAPRSVCSLSQLTLSPPSLPLFCPVSLTFGWYSVILLGDSMKIKFLAQEHSTMT